MNFLTSRMSSWQAHLQRLSPYFLPSKGVWWQTTEEGYKFLDGTAEPAERCEGPPLHHFRDTTLEQVYKQKESIWPQIIEKRVVLPVPYIKLYDTDGQYIGRRLSLNPIAPRWNHNPGPKLPDGFTTPGLKLPDGTTTPGLKLPRWNHNPRPKALRWNHNPRSKAPIWNHNSKGMTWYY